MELQVSAALKLPGKVFEGSFAERLPDQEFGGRKLTFAEPVRLDITYSYDGEALALSGELAVVLSSLCASCNETFCEKLNIPVDERFVKGELPQDTEAYSFDADRINLDTMVLDNIFLSIPIRSLCKEDCAGLCPACGCNKNMVSCSCDVWEEKSPLAALSQLLKDDKEV
ncbi:DUF177 domain-containing protein [Eubacteriales bacterium OttesenSCG-928-K08]|nr:DUF177 domain-containing protein [Eubacteriales bacterium OttesenSCG-928-K08]